MGVWSASITGNDTAMDLRSEYTAAFYHYEIPEALEKIEAYVRADGFDESDAEEWCNYVYSLADFMWRKGILTDEVLRRALDMIDSGFGLDAWAAEGAAMLRDRKKALEKFRAKITSPQPERKKIKPDLYLEDIFSHGDVIALQLQTAGKHYCRADVRPMTDEFFHSLDGKYILIQKVGCTVSWSSKIAPEIGDHWPEFRVFKGIYDAIPDGIDLNSLRAGQIYQENFPRDFFCTEGSLSYFKRRKYKVIGNCPAPTARRSCQIFLSVNTDSYNADSDLLIGAIRQKSWIQRIFRP